MWCSRTRRLGLTRPIAMPETGGSIGTPGVPSTRGVRPQTEPIDEEPLDSSVSETMRISVREHPSRGRERLEEHPLCDYSRGRCRAASASPCDPLSPPRGQEVVMCACRAGHDSSERLSMRWSSSPCRRQQGHDLRLAAGEEPRAVGAGRDHDLDLDRADLVAVRRRGDASRPRSSGGRGSCRSTCTPS